MTNTNFQPISKNTFKSLAENRGLYCVSIFLSMHKAGKEQNEHLAQENLKQCIKRVTKELTEHQLSESEIRSYLNPIEKLILNIKLWRNPDDGLAIFLDKNGLKYYTLPIAFKNFTYVANHFYVLPLFPLFEENGRYYMLELSEDYVQLYEATKFGFKKIYVEEFIPNQLEKAVGYDYKQKMLHFRSGQDSFGGGSFHGHGDGKDDHKKELMAFSKAIDNGIKKVLLNENLPLILACTDPLFNLYKKTSTYLNLYTFNISGDPEFTDKSELHSKSWELIKPYFEKSKNNKINQFKELYNTPKIAYDASEIILAAYNGKVDTLFVQNKSDLFGTVDNEHKRVSFNSKKNIKNGSLINLSAVNTFLKGGNVYLLSPEKMPGQGCELNALYRY